MTPFVTLEGAGTDAVDGRAALGVTGMAAVCWHRDGTEVWEIRESLEFPLVL